MGGGSGISEFFFLGGGGVEMDGQTQTNLPILLLKDNNCAKLF